MNVRNLAMVFGPNILRSGVSFQVIGLHVKGYDFSLFQIRSTLRRIVISVSVHFIETSKFLQVSSDLYGEIRVMYSGTVALW